MEQSFTKQFEFGREAESRISAIFKKCGWGVIPIEKTDDGKKEGPRISIGEEIKSTSPDLLVFKEKDVRWIEVKRRTAFCWNRTRKIWTTGISKNEFSQYELVDRLTPWKIQVFFVQEKGTAKDTPDGMVGPNGIFFGSLQYLRDRVNHESKKIGKGGMLFWNHKDLKYLTTEYPTVRL